MTTRTTDIYDDARVALEALQCCRTYLEQRADAEHFTDSASPVPNEEARLLEDVEVAIRVLCLGVA